MRARVSTAKMKWQSQREGIEQNTVQIWVPPCAELGKDQARIEWDRWLILASTFPSEVPLSPSLYGQGKDRIRAYPLKTPVVDDVVLASTASDL